MLHFFILGQMEIHTSTKVVRPSGTLQCMLLMALLSNASRLVPTDALIRELWGERPPARVENALQAHISRLRSLLSSLEPEAVQPRLITHPAGYRLLVGPGELDAAVFAALLEESRGRAAQDPAVAGELRQMLTLCRGPVLGGLTGGFLTQAAAARYEEMRLAALELLYDCELRNGRATQIIPELRDLLVEHSFNERLWQQLMIALYRSGRQAEALAVYRTFWRRLSEEMGLEPSSCMRSYERAILDQNPVLDLHMMPHDRLSSRLVAEGRR